MTKNDIPSEDTLNFFEKSLNKKDYRALIEILDLAAIPAEIFKRKNLLRINNSRITDLWLDNLGYKEFPNALGELESLTYLDLEQNQLSFLPDLFGSLTSLTGLVLNNNKFLKYPEIINKLENLKYLKLSSNALEIIPNSISNLENLRYLMIDQCELREMPIEIGELSSLRYINISKNPIHTLPESILKVSLKKIRLSKTRINYDDKILIQLRKKGVLLEI